MALSGHWQCGCGRRRGSRPGPPGAESYDHGLITESSMMINVAAISAGLRLGLGLPAARPGFQRVCQCQESGSPRHHHAMMIMEQRAARPRGPGPAADG